MNPQLLVLGLIGATSCQAAGPQAPGAIEAVEAVPVETLSTLTDATPTTIDAPLQHDVSIYDRLPDVAERAVLSVVNIATEKTVAVQQSPFSQDPFFGSSLVSVARPRCHVSAESSRGARAWSYPPMG